MMRLSSRSDGRGRPLNAVISEWAAANPRIRREPVDIDWYDPDTETPSPVKGNDGRTLVYERGR